VKADLREVEASRDEEAERKSWKAVEGFLRGDVWDALGPFT
jgi:hypothetical protein